MEGTDGLLSCYLLDGKGGGESIGWEGIRSWKPEQGSLWVHLDRKAPEADRWLREESGLDELACEALLAEDTRPRCTVIGECLLVILRGVNLNANADPEDMISIRLWLEAGRVISLRYPRLVAVQDIRESLSSGEGPQNPGDFLAELNERLLSRMSGVLDELQESINDLEEEILEAHSHDLRSRLADLRRQAITLRRYISPQREVLVQLQSLNLPWLSNLHRARLREMTDRITRYVEDLDSMREHAAVAQDELNARLSDQMNRTMYILSLITAVFLPLGLLTGLLGINVAGMPGVDNGWAFTYVCIILVVLAVIQIILFRRLRFF